MSVVIAGCGDLGTEIGLRLAGRGHHVIGLRRRAEVLPAEIEGRSVDLAAGAVALPADTEAIVIATTADERSEAAYRRAYVETLEHLLDAAEGLATPPRRIILVSSTAVHGASDEGWIDETTALGADTETGAVLIEAEELLRRRAPEAVVLRLGGIYGPGRDQLVRELRSGIDVVPRAAVWVNLIHRDDAAGAAVHLLGIDDPQPVYLGVDGKPVQRRDIAAFLAQELGLPIPADDETPVSGKRVSGARLRESGYSFAYPDFRAGYRAVLDGEGVRHP